MKFPLKEGVGRAKVEFECGKKNSVVECRFQLDPAYQNIDLDIYSGAQLIYSVPAKENCSDSLFAKPKVDFEESSEGDLIEIKANGEVLFSGQLALD